MNTIPIVCFLVKKCIYPNAACVSLYRMTKVFNSVFSKSFINNIHLKSD